MSFDVICLISTLLICKESDIHNQYATIKTMVVKENPGTHTDTPLGKNNHTAL
jgi:hypothetical protein